MPTKKKPKTELEFMQEIHDCYSAMDTQGGQVHVSARTISRENKKLEGLFRALGRRVGYVEAGNALVGTEPRPGHRVPLIKMPEVPWESSGPGYDALIEAEEKLARRRS